MRWTDCQGNIHIRSIDCPERVSNFFSHSNRVDSQNQLHQRCLALEKCWVTQDCWFRLHTTITGIHIINTLGLCQHNGLVQGSYTISEFTGEFTHQLLEKAKKLRCLEPPRKLQTMLHFGDRIPSPHVIHMDTPPC
jgi:hypothetical protein